MVNGDPIKGIFNQFQELTIINIFQQKLNRQRTRAKVEPKQQQIKVDLTLTSFIFVLLMFRCFCPDIWTTQLFVFVLIFHLLLPVCCLYFLNQKEKLFCKDKQRWTIGPDEVCALPLGVTGRKRDSWQKIMLTPKIVPGF